jgi:hypothetical protein
MHWSGWSLPGNSCRRRPGGQPADAGKSSPVAAKAAAIDAAQARPLTWKTVVKRALAVAMAGAALYLVLPKLIAVPTVPGLTRGTAGPRRCGRRPVPAGQRHVRVVRAETGCLAAAGAESLPSSKVIAVRPQSWHASAAMIFGTRCDRKASACTSPLGAPVTQVRRGRRRTGSARSGERRGGHGRIAAVSGTGSPLLPAAPGTRGP